MLVCRLPRPRREVMRRARTQTSLTSQVNSNSLAHVPLTVSLLQSVSTTVLLDTFVDAAATTDDEDVSVSALVRAGRASTETLSLKSASVEPIADPTTPAWSFVQSASHESISVNSSASPASTKSTSDVKSTLEDSVSVKSTSRRAANDTASLKESDGEVRRSLVLHKPLTLT